MLCARLLKFCPSGRKLLNQLLCYVVAQISLPSEECLMLLFTGNNHHGLHLALAFSLQLPYADVMLLLPVGAQQTHA
jgi:hypothetical protein